MALVREHCHSTGGSYLLLGRRLLGDPYEIELHETALW